MARACLDWRNLVFSRILYESATSKVYSAFNRRFTRQCHCSLVLGFFQSSIAIKDSTTLTITASIVQTTHTLSPHPGFKDAKASERNAAYNALCTPNRQ